MYTIQDERANMQSQTCVNDSQRARQGYLRLSTLKTDNTVRLSSRLQLWGSLRSPEILGNIARPLSILLRGLEALWSPWIGISVPYPCATALTLALVLALALALALAPVRLALALPTSRPLHRLTLRT